jgi:hypothetical protein
MHVVDEGLAILLLRCEGRKQGALILGLSAGLKSLPLDVLLEPGFGLGRGSSIGSETSANQRKKRNNRAYGE